MAAKSNQEIGAESLARLREFLDRAAAVPERNGKANISAIALASSVDRQVLYRPDARALIEAAVAAKGLGMPDQQPRARPDELPTWAKRQIMDLQAQLTTARAEAADLRQQLRRLDHLERHLTETGMLPR